MLSLCVRLLDLSAIAGGGFPVEHGVLETNGFAHRRRLVVTEERRPAVRDERLHGFSSSSLNAVGRPEVLRRSPAARERRLP